MLIWLTMLINEKMFHNIGSETTNILQFISFIELFIEAAIVAALLIMTVGDLLKKRENND